MGIKQLNEFLKSRCGKDLWQIVPLSCLEGHRVAADISIFVHRCASGACKKALDETDLDSGDLPDVQIVLRYFFDLFLKMISSFVSNNIIPICVLDGTAPDSKKAEQEKRREEGKKKQKIILQLQEELRAYPEPTNKVEEAEKEEKVDIFRGAIKNNATYFLGESDVYKAKLKTFLAALGVPIVRAPAEAEQMCSYLVKAGLCSAAVTSDTDVHAHRCPVMIDQLFGEGEYYTAARVVIFANILDGLNLTPEAFVDLCIMLGTDHNKNVFGFGPETCYPLIVEYGSLDNIPKLIYSAKKKDYIPYPKEKLNYEYVRTVFETDICGETLNKDDLLVTVVDEALVGEYLGPNLMFRCYKKHHARLRLATGYKCFCWDD